MKVLVIFILMCVSVTFLVLSCQTGTNTTPAGGGGSTTVITANTNYFDNLGKGINLGNYLEGTPGEGSWTSGDLVQQAYFTAIKAAGFDTVRIPIRWSAHALNNSPYTIDATFFSRVDTIVTWALDAGLCVVINIHHYNESGHNLYEVNTDAETPRFLSLWSQIANRYKNYSDFLYFELLNEPYTSATMTYSKYNNILQQAVNTIRAVDNRHPIIITPLGWSWTDGLAQLTLPSDSKLIATIHYYDPMIFTHQGADWADTTTMSLQGVIWPNQLPDPTNKITSYNAGPNYISNQITDYNNFNLSMGGSKSSIIAYMTSLSNWSAQKNVGMWIGEFGAYSGPGGTNDMPSRAKWTSFVRTTAEKYGLTWCYWEFNQGFGAYNLQNSTWKIELSNALLTN